MENTWGRGNEAAQLGGYGTCPGVHTLFQAVPLGRLEHPQVSWQVHTHVKGIFFTSESQLFTPVELRVCKRSSFIYMNGRK